MADSKITGLSANSTPASEDLLVTVDDPSGTPATKKTTIGELDTTLSATSKTLTNKTINSASNTITITESNISDLGSYITASSTETLTNKTIDANGTGNSITNIEAADLASSAKTGTDSKVVTGTEGTSGNVAMWNDDGDIVDGSIVAANILDSSDIGSSVQAYSSVLDATTASFTTADEAKLDGIEASADVTDETNVKAAISGATITSATVASGDKVIIQDADDSDNIKTVTAQSIADLGSSGTDDAAIHDNVADEISAITEKETPVSADLLLIEDSEDSNSKKKVQIGNLPGGGGGSSPWDVTSNVMSNTGTGADETVDDFVLGSDQLDDDGNALHDSRLIFDKSKGYFAIGAHSSTGWDDSKRGVGSINIGINCETSGTECIAVGQSSVVKGDKNVAVGYDIDITNTSSNNWVAVGNNIECNGEDYNYMFGRYLRTASTSAGGNCIVIGRGSGSGTFALTPRGVDNEVIIGNGSVYPAIVISASPATSGSTSTIRYWNQSAASPDYAFIKTLIPGIKGTSSGTGEVMCLYTTSADGEVVMAEASVVGVTNTTFAHQGAYKIRAFFKRVSGTLTQVGTTQVDYSEESDASWLGAIFVVNGSNIELHVGSDGTNLVRFRGYMDLTIQKH